MVAPSPSRQPALFIGHGSPMNAIEDNRYSRALRALGAKLPRPRAILCVSAHWFVRGTWVTGEERPRTIHDFGGFPRALFDMVYPAPGDPALARRVGALLGEGRGAPRLDWGLDHGTWTVLCHLFPDADVPVVQLALDATLAPAGHLELGRRLAPLRDEGILLLGSGNVTHNLRHALSQLGAAEPPAAGFAVRFDAAVEEALAARDGARLAGLLETPDGRMAHPTPDHYYPLLYVAGAASEGDALDFPVTGLDLGSLSMRAARFG